jgi:NAD(P)-dependent dehydrogenase (short-subunit alcohol dehydrogenase family)
VRRLASGGPGLVRRLPVTGFSGPDPGQGQDVNDFSSIGSGGRAGVAVVTGGSAGLGRAIVRELAGLGYDVAVLARESDGLHGASREVELAGRRGLAVPADVADAEAVDAAADRIERELGPIDVWVNNAMTSVFATFLDIEPAEYERATRVTYLGFVNGTRAALRRMAPRDRGHIVQIGSSLAFRGIPLQSAYCGAKHAMVGFTESVQAELDHGGSAVRMSMVHMPALNTPQFGWVRSRLPMHPQPVPPIFQPEVGARAVGYVVQHPRRRTAVTWRTSAIAIGNMLAPRVFDRIVAKTGFQGQQTDQQLPVYGDNLDKPVPEDIGAHGSFGDRAKRSSPGTWANLTIGRALGAAAGLAGSAVSAANGRTRELLGAR